MKTICLDICGLTVIFLLGLTAMVSAQDVVYATTDREAQRRQREMMRSPAMQQAQRNAAKQAINSFWNGNGADLMAMGLLHDDDYWEGIGVSREQQQKKWGDQLVLPFQKIRVH